jgi:Flp pilus assembly protein TadG
MIRLQNKWLSRGRDQSGQALVEFMFVGFILLFMLFAMIDFCRMISTRQVLINLSREGANEAARGQGDTVDASISNALAAVVAGANPLNITTKGRVIITAVQNTGTKFTITNQGSIGGISATSRIAPLGVGSTTTLMPYLATAAGAIPQSNQTSYVTEVFYSFTPATSLGSVAVGGLHGFTVTNQLYDIAYF